MKKLIPILILVLIACNKSEDRSCWKFTGDFATKEVPLGNFEKIFMGPHLRYTLVQDTVEKVILEGGENLLNFIETSIDDDKTLIIKDNNECGFLRVENDPVHVKIHVKKIHNILFEGTHEVTCENTINTDYMTLILRDGAGEFNLDINALMLYTTAAYGWGNFNIKGDVGYFNLQLRENGFGKAYNLNVADSIHVISYSTETVKVNTGTADFKAQTHSTGHIWYIGAPSNIEYIQYGSGELVNKN